MPLPIIIECRLGRVVPEGASGTPCEYIKDNTIYRCSGYIPLKGKNPQDEEMIDEWRCIDHWLPVLLVENAQTNRGQTAAFESFRNAVNKNQNEFNKILALAISGVSASPEIASSSRKQLKSDG